MFTGGKKHDHSFNLNVLICLQNFRISMYHCLNAQEGKKSFQEYIEYEENQKVLQSTGELVKESQNFSNFQDIRENNFIQVKSPWEEKTLL